MISFFVAGIPQSKGSWKSYGKGRFVADNPHEPGWAALVGWEAKIAMRFYFDRVSTALRDPLEGPIALSLAFILPKPIGRKHRRDIDKLARSVLDALTGIVYIDDEQVAKLEADKITADRHGVRIHVERWKPTTEN